MSSCLWLSPAATLSLGWSRVLAAWNRLWMAMWRDFSSMAFLAALPWASAQRSSWGTRDPSLQSCSSTGTPAWRPQIPLSPELGGASLAQAQAGVVEQMQEPAQLV